MVELRTLGSLDVKGADGRQLHSLVAQPKRVALLAYLAVATPRGFHRRDTVLALFWPDADQERARQALRQALHVLRRTLGAHTIVGRGDDEIAVDRGALWCDAAAFDDALDAGRVAEALELFRGDFLAGFFLSDAPEFERWVEGERARLRARAVKAAWQIAEAEEAAGHPVDAGHWARRAASLASDDEASLRRLIGLLHRLGDRAGALRAYDEFAKRLAREYEVEPSAETRELVRAIRGEPTGVELPGDVGGAAAGAATRAATPAATPAATGTAASALAGATPPAAGGAPPIEESSAAELDRSHRNRALGITPAPRRRIRLAAAAAVVLAALISLTVLGRSARRKAAAEHAAGAPVPGTSTAGRDTATHGYLASVAVLPFDNLGGRPEDEYFSDGITDEIIGRLAGIGRLKVISRTSVVALKGRPLTLPQIADTLGVRHIVEGSVRRSGNRVRVTVQLIDAASDSHLWSHFYDRELSDVFAIQTDVALRIAGALKGTLLPSDSARFDRRPTDDLAAYSAYLKGRYYWNRRTETDLRRALALFQDATARDPRYALAYAGLADTYIILGNFRLLPPREAYPKAKAAALEALALDDDLAEALVALAFARFLHDWDWAAAARDFERALALNPNYAVGHQWYAVYLAGMKRPAEALVEIQRAAELDPLSLTINAVTGWIALLARHYDLAAANARRTLELDPNFPLGHYYLVQALAQLGRHADALAEARALVRIDSTPRTRSELALAHARVGERAQAVAILGQLEASARERYVSPLDIAAIHAALGDPDAAFQWLERAYEVRDPWLVLLGVEPKLDPLRTDARFARLARRMRLPE